MRGATADTLVALGSHWLDLMTFVTGLKDPSLLSDEARQVAAYPGGHQEGFPDTFKQLTGKVYGY